MTDSKTTERRFQSTAPYYVRYRPRYPRVLIDAVADTRHLDGRGRLLDLGTGPGFLAIALAPRFEATVAMDPEPEMVTAAEAEARAAGITLTLVLGGSEDLGPHLGRFRLVTMGRSFHWMDRDRTLVALDALIEADGAIGLFDDDHPEVPENAWYPTWKAVRDQYTPASRRRDWHAAGTDEVVLSRSPFPVVRRLTHRWPVRVSIGELLGRMLSTSLTTPAVLGDTRADLEADLHHALAPFAVDGLVDEVLEAEALIATRA
jgi:SAM-dependent methyltransferase